MITIERAQNIIRRALPQPGVQSLALDEAAGLFLAEDVRAPEPLPHFDNSAMDGYAVALASLPGGSEMVELPVVGEAQAGRPYTDALGPGQAVKISTGAVVPEGADRVIPVEKTEERSEHVRLHDRCVEGDHIRRTGEEVVAGAIIARARDQLTPPLIGRLASFGIGQVEAFRPPRGAVLTTGSELVDVGASRASGQISNANGPALIALLRQAGLVPVLVEIVPDGREETVQAIDRAAGVADILLVTGGVSVGPHDHVKNAARQVGFTKEFWKVRQKPGKPLYFATRGKRLLFGLPGNPFSALINALVYVYPVIRRLCGDPHPGLSVVEGRLVRSFDRLKPGRAKFLLVRIKEQTGAVCRLEVSGRQRSDMLSGMSVSDGFIIVPADQERISPDESFLTRLFPWSDTGQSFSSATFQARHPAGATGRSV